MAVIVKQYGVIIINPDAEIMVLKVPEKKINLHLIQGLIHKVKDEDVVQVGTERIASVTNEWKNHKLCMYFCNTESSNLRENRFGSAILGDNIEIPSEEEMVYGTMVFTGVDPKISPMPVGFDLDDSFTQELFDTLVKMKRVYNTIGEAPEKKYAVVVINQDSSTEVRYLNHRAISLRDTKDLFGNDCDEMLAMGVERVSTVLNCVTNPLDASKNLVAVIVDKNYRSKKGEINYLGSFLISNSDSEPKYLRDKMVLGSVKIMNGTGIATALPLDDDFLDLYKKVKLLSVQALNSGDIQEWFKKRNSED